MLVLKSIDSIEVNQPTNLFYMSAWIYCLIIDFFIVGVGSRIDMGSFGKLHDNKVSISIAPGSG
jgi:hypothetical protein